MSLPLLPTPNFQVSLQDVQTLFEQWRQARTSRFLPDSLKFQVAALIGRYSKNEISKTLRISYLQIKHYTQAHTCSDPLPTPDFIQIPSLAVADVPAAHPPSSANPPLLNFSATQPCSSLENPLVSLSVHQREASLQTHIPQDHVLSVLQTFLEKA